MRKALLLLLFLLLLPQTAKADITSYQWGTTGSVACGTYGNTQVVDNTWLSCTSRTSFYIDSGGFSTFGVPSGATINGFWYNIRLKNNTPGIFLFPRFSSNSGSSYSVPSSCNGVSNCPFEMPTTMGTITNYIPNNGITQANLTSGISTFRFSVIDYGSTASYNIDIDAFYVAVDYTPSGATPTPTPSPTPAIGGNGFWTNTETSTGSGILALRDSLNTRAPFAYIAYLVNLDTDICYGGGCLTWAPDGITIPMTSHLQSLSGIEEMTADLTTQMGTGNYNSQITADSSPMKMAMRVMIYSATIVYVVLLIKRIV